MKQRNLDDLKERVARLLRGTYRVSRRARIIRRIVGLICCDALIARNE